jgi:hypothetical protein
VRAQSEERAHPESGGRHCDDRTHECKRHVAEHPARPAGQRGEQKFGVAFHFFCAQPQDRQGRVGCQGVPQTHDGQPKVDVYKVRGRGAAVSPKELLDD